MRGSLDGRATLSPDRLVSYLAWVRAICSLRLGWYRAAADRALFWFARRYQGQPRASREELVNVLCKTFDEALSAGRQGEIDPAHAAAAMDRYERKTGFVPQSFLITHFPQSRNAW